MIEKHFYNYQIIFFSSSDLYFYFHLQFVLILTNLSNPILNIHPIIKENLFSIPLALPYLFLIFYQFTTNLIYFIDSLISIQYSVIVNELARIKAIVYSFSLFLIHIVIGFVKFFECLRYLFYFSYIFYINSY